MDPATYTLTLFIALPFLASVVLWLWYQWKNRRVLSFARTLPIAEPTIPFLGHLHRGLPDIDGIISNCGLSMSRKAASESLGAFCLWAGPMPFIMIQKPDDVQLLLNSTKSLERASDYRLIKFALGDGLFTAPVKLWTQLRRHLLPMFLPRNYELMIPELNRQGRQIVEEMKENVGRPQVDMFHFIVKYNVSITGYLLFGSTPLMNLNPKSSLVQDIFEIVERAFQLFTLRMIRVWLQWDPLFEFLYKKDLEKLKLLSTFAQPIIEDMKERTESSVQIKPTTMGTVTPQIELVDAFCLLMKSNPNVITERNLENLINNLFGAGSEPATIALSSCVLVLAQYPKIQDRVFEEIEQTIGRQKNDVTSSDIRKMEYLDRVLKETMRLFPVAPFVGRKVTEDIQTSLGVIPAGTDVYIDIYGNHMNPNVYPDPERFDPDRFLPDNVSKRHKFTFMPFSGGSRNCIGKEYSMTVMKIQLVHIFRRYKISTNTDPLDNKFIYRSTMVRDGGYPVSVQERL